MPYPPFHSVIPLGKDLLHPLQYLREILSVLRLDIKDKPVGVNTETPDLEGKAAHGFLEDPVEKADGLALAKDGFTVVNTGAYFIPDTLGVYS
jgi:hypothetical protein